MARLARIVAPGCPRPVTARGNRREPIFFGEGDQDIYGDLLAEQMRRARVEVWSYCLMPNHVHLILVPDTADGMAQALGAASRSTKVFYVPHLRSGVGRSLTARVGWV
jgi:putative transposase